MHDTTAIISAWKEHATISRAVSALATATDDVIVVAPDDDTLQAAEKAGARIIRDTGKGKPAALNLAIAHAKGEVLILTDGDVWTKHAERLLAHFRDPGVGAVTGRPLSIAKKDSMLGYWSKLLTAAAHHERKQRKGHHIDCSGYLFAVRKSLASRFPEDLLAEDAYLSSIVTDRGYRIVYEPRAVAYVTYPDSFRDWMLQKKRSAGGYDQLKRMGFPSPMRSFTKEAGGIWFAAAYPQTIRESWWTFLLVLARAYLWLRIWHDLRLRGECHQKTWKRVESTKRSRLIGDQ